MGHLFLPRSRKLTPAGPPSLAAGEKYNWILTVDIWTVGRYNTFPSTNDAPNLHLDQAYSRFGGGSWGAESGIGMANHALAVDGVDVCYSNYAELANGALFGETGGQAQFGAVFDSGAGGVIETFDLDVGNGGVVGVALAYIEIREGTTIAQGALVATSEEINLLNLTQTVQFDEWT